jgi:DNA-binding response OmpR family regulator
MEKYILLVDDDPLLRRSLSFNLERSGYRADAAASGEEALALAQSNPPDLVLLDIGLPGMNGLDALRQLRSGVTTPVIFLTARRRELDEVLGLELGADDYITKPFDLDVLLARIRVALRHAQAATAPARVPRSAGDITIDPIAHIAAVGGRSLDLSPREFDLLYALVVDAGHVVTVDDLLAAVWGAGYSGEPQVVYVHIRWLRQKLEDDPSHPRRIITVRGVGYKLEPQAI